MAIETKVMQVQNRESVINDTNEAMSCFGWNVLNVQITHNQNTKTFSSAWDQLGGNQTQTVETTTINYATITYQRDKSLTHYSEIVALEEEFNYVMSTLEEYRAKQNMRDNIGCLLWLIWPVALYRLIKSSSNGKKESAMEKEIQKLEKRRENILREAQTLLD